MLTTHQIAKVMDQFETNSEAVDTTTQLYDEMTKSATATATPQDDVDRLLAQAADKAGVELSEDLQSATPAKSKLQNTEQAEDGLDQRLRALRN
jgi:charged multivesicular body protein 1